MVPTIQYNPTGNPQTSFSNLGSQRIAQVETAGTEMGRSGRSFVGGTAVVAGGLASVVDLPASTVVSWVLYNSQPAASVIKCLVVKRLTAFFCSSTINAPASGFSIFAGVPPTPQLAAGIPAANGANIRTQATRGFGTPLGLLSISMAIPVGTCWSVLAATTNITVAATTGPSTTVDLSNTPFIVPPGFVLAVGILGSTTGTPVYGISMAWDECECVLN